MSRSRKYHASQTRGRPADARRCRKHLAPLAAAAALLCAMPARAANETWACAADDWATAACWSGGALPGASDDAFITSSSASVSFGLYTPAVNVHTLNIGASTGTAALNIGFGSLAASTYIYVGATGTGMFNSGGQASGGVFSSTVTTATLYVGQVSGSSGTYNQNASGSLVVSNNLDLAGSGTGTFNQNGGSVQLGRLDMAWDASGAATGGTGVALYNMNGGSFSAGTARIAVNGSGTFAQSDGSVAFRSSVVPADASTAHGLYLLSGGTLSTYALSTGSGDGRVYNVGGTHRANSIQISTTGSYSINGGVLNVDNLTLAGHGKLNVSSGELHALGPVGIDVTGGQIVFNGGVFDAPSGVRAFDFTVGSQASFSNVAGSVVAVGHSLSNDGRWTNAGGAIYGPGVFSSSGSFVGHGDISAVFNNQGTVLQDAGTLVLSNPFSAATTATGRCRTPPRCTSTTGL